MRRAVPVLGALVAHTALVVGLTWPLASAPHVLLPAPTILSAVDGYLDAWNLAWQSHALVTAPGRLLDGNIYHPTRLALLYGDIDYSAVPYFAPTFLATGSPALALNLLLLGCLALTATGIHLVVARWTRSHAAGLVGGATFLTAPWVLWTWVATNPIYAVLHYLPPLVFLAAMPSPSVRRALAIALLALLQGLASVYLAVTTLISLGTLAAARLVRPATRRAGALLAGATLLAAVGIAAAGAGLLVVRAENPDLRYQTLFTLVRWGPTVIPWGPFSRGDVLGVSSVCWPIVGVGMLAAWRRRERDADLRRGWQHATLWMAMGFLLALTRVVRVAGYRVRPPPQQLLDLLGFYNLVRQPPHLAVPGLVGTALLVGVGFGECLRRLPARTPAMARSLRGASCVLALVALVYGHTRPVPVMTSVATPQLGHYPVMRPPRGTGSLMARLRAGDGPLLELPCGPGAVEAADAMYRSIFHWRPLLNGYSGYWPVGFPERMSLACELPDADALARLVQETGVTEVVVNLAALPSGYAPAGVRPKSPYVCPWPAETPDRRRMRWLEAIAGLHPTLRPVMREGQKLLFAVRQDGSRPAVR